eukprot:13276468-Alexandrium_andersonii.AAC.1
MHLRTQACKLRLAKPEWRVERMLDRWGGVGMGGRFGNDWHLHLGTSKNSTAAILARARRGSTQTIVAHLTSQSLQDCERIGVWLLA